MKSVAFLIIAISSFSPCCRGQNSADATAIRNTITEWNNAAMNKDLEKAIALFDSSSTTMVIGAVSTEVFRGFNQIRESLVRLFAKPFRLSWDIGDVTIDQNKETAWAFMSGTLHIKPDNGPADQKPYRMMIVMIRTGQGWKWRLYNGSVPI